MPGPSDVYQKAKEKEKENTARESGGYDLGGLANKYLGRSFTPEEEAYVIRQKEGFDEYANSPGYEKVVSLLAGTYKKIDNQIKRELGTYGIKDEDITANGLTLDDLRKQAFDITLDDRRIGEVVKDGSLLSDYRDAISSSIGNAASQITSKKIQDEIDRKINPGKYLDETQKTANTATAQRLLKQTYGDDFNDPDLQDFISERLAGGESAFELSQFLQTTPQFQERKATQENERVKTESAAAREALNQELLKSQQEVFQRATPSIISSYMKAGRLNSSGLQNALTQAQADLERERQGFLANAGYNDAIRAQGYGREDFVRNQGAAFNQYLRQNEPAYQQRFAVNQAQNFANFQQPYNNLARQYQLSDESRNRQYQLEDYNRQQSDFNRYLDQYRSQGRENALYGLAGNVIGAGARAGFGKLFGA